MVVVRLGVEWTWERQRGVHHSGGGEESKQSLCQISLQKLSAGVDVATRALPLAGSPCRLRGGIVDLLGFQHAMPGPSATQWSSSRGTTAGNSAARVPLWGLPS